MANRLAREQSPYLLQHQDNPVDWYPWGEEAFARARATGRPIFLSIGYSTCHWCHVMAHESFESPEIADVMNRHFVAVKVDREERPDVDRVYMTFVQATTGSGGWPMSVWLTPELEPFYGATYFPPTSRWGRPGFIDVLNEIARAWREERPRVVASAASILDRLRALNGAEAGDRSPGADELARTVAEFAERFDQQRGGFGGAPKFPRPSELLFLFREHARTGAEAPAMMALRTLEAMADGGMRDQIGGGFHRYSVDAEWRVPHFEKMLYDQAQLVLAYLEATQVTRAARYGVVAAHTLAYVVRDLSDPAGGFHSAEDADSVPAAATGAAAHPREGAFYVWTEAEMREVLGEDAAVAIARFGVKPGGNAPADPQGEFAGQNILYVARSIEEVAASTGRPVLEVTGALTRVRQALFDARRGRPAPHLDDKVLTAWNGLMIGALARAARVLPDGAGSLRAAVRAAEFLRTTVWDAQTERLFRRYRRGEVGVAAYAEDYAYLIFGLLELFQTTGSVTWLEWALTLQRQQDALFWDEAGGGWFSTTGDDPSVLLRLKDDYDGAEPAASSVGAANLLMLAHLTGDAGWGERVDAVFRMYASRLATSGRTVPMLLSALSVRESGIAQVLVVGEPGEPAFDGMLRVVRSQYLPQAIVVPVSVAERPALEALLPWTAVLRVPAGESRAFVCREFTCNQPCATPEELLAQLDALRPDPR